MPTPIVLIDCYGYICVRLQTKLATETLPSTFDTTLSSVTSAARSTSDAISSGPCFCHPNVRPLDSASTPPPLLVMRLRTSLPASRSGTISANDIQNVGVSLQQAGTGAISGIQNASVAVAGGLSDALSAASALAQQQSVDEQEEEMAF